MNPDDFVNVPGVQIKESIQSLTESKAIVRKIGNPNRILLDDAFIESKVLGLKPIPDQQQHQPKTQASIPIPAAAVASQPAKMKAEPELKKVIVLIPVGIPGMGKTVLIQS